MATVIRGTQRNPEPAQPRWRSAGLVAFAFIGLLLALGSYSVQDPSLNTFRSQWAEPQNVLGYFGSWTADLFYQAFGFAAWLWPLFFIAGLIRWIASSDKSEAVLSSRNWGSLFLLTLSATLLLALLQSPGSQHNPSQGFPTEGLLGVALSKAAIPLLGRIGSYFLVCFMLWSTCLLIWENFPSRIADAFQEWRAHRGKSRRSASDTSNNAYEEEADEWDEEPEVLEADEEISARVHSSKKAGLFSFVGRLFSGINGSRNKQPLREVDEAEPHAHLQIEAAEEPSDAFEWEDDGEYEADEDFEEELEERSGSRPLLRLKNNRQEAPKTRKTSRPKAGLSADEVEEWETPPLSLLQSPRTKIKGPSEEELLQTADKISAALESFDIDGEVVEVSPGPIITMYEFQPAPGVRVNKLVSASTDLAMTLGVPSVRVVAPIPGKCVAGIEVPNALKQEIVLRDVYENTQNRAANFKLPMIFGVDTEGTPICEDLARMPHLLIGGATNMGKSVLVNSLLSGLLCRFTPHDLKLIVVDPKLVEFKIFEDIPHLLLPIVNDPSDASQALKWAVGETKRRYLEMQKVAAKNLEAYNKKFDEGKLDEDAERLPYIVIVIDELAELMLTAKKDVEQSIVRLSQLARAAGIHLIMATQRPSADVVTGLIKSNCPSRASLRVASASDSRIILDCSGAEQLLGKGDMFFTNAGPMGLKRMQGAYVSDEEIERICDFWREQGEPSYREEILAPEEDLLSSMNGDDPDVDALFGDILEFAREKGKISTSLIQRRFQIGYTRAARIMDQLESKGVVGEASAAGKPRDVIL